MNLSGIFSCGNSTHTMTMKKDKSKNSFRGVILLVLLLFVATAGFAQRKTHVVTFTDATTTNSVTTFTFTQTVGATTTWRGTGFSNSLWNWESGIQFRPPLFSSGTGRINGTIPKTWRVYRVTIHGHVSSGVSTSLSVNGVSLTVSGSPQTNPFAYVSASGVPGDPASTAGTIVLSISFPGSSLKYFWLNETIEIEYEDMDVTAPELTWPDDNDYQYSSIPATIQACSSEPLRINGSTAINQVNIQNLVGLYDADNNKLEASVAFTENGCNASSDRIVVTPAAGVLQNCGTYTIRVSETITDTAANVITAATRSWTFKTPSPSYSVTGGKTQYLTGEPFTTEGWVVTVDGVDVTAECTFSNPAMNTVGNKVVTITHGLCTTTRTINVRDPYVYSITWSVLGSVESLTPAVIIEGNAIGTLPTPASTEVLTDCGLKSFIGWTTSAITTPQDELPPLISGAVIPTASTTYYAVYASGTTSADYVQITNVSELSDGMQIVISTSDADVAMAAASSNGNNFTATTVTKSGVSLTPNDKVTEFTLQAGLENGTWSFYTGSSYLYAGSSSSNRLQTETTKSANGSWAISITGGEASIVAQGTNTRNTMAYNATTSPAIFACYAPTTAVNYSKLTLYKKEAGVHAYITSCVCTSPAISGTTPTSVQPGVPYPFGLSSNSSGKISYSSTAEGITITGNTFSVTSIGDYAVTLTQEESNPYCRIEYHFTLAIGTLESCAAYTMHYGTREVSGWNAGDCFTQNGTGNEWYIANYTIPEVPHYWVGWKNSWSTTDAKSADADFANLPFALLQGKSGSCTNALGWGMGVGQGAVGTIRIFSNSNDNNKYIGFIPDGYVFRWGTDAAGWTSYPMTATNEGKTVWETAIQNLTTANIDYSYYVGLKTATDYVWCNNSESLQVKGDMGQKSGAGSWGTNLATGDAGKVGKFRIWADNCSKNFSCHFVPYYNITYMAADNTTVFETSTLVSCEGELSTTITNGRPLKDGYRLIGWSTTANAETATYGPGDAFTLTTNHVLYPVYVEAVTLTYNLNGGTGECNTGTYDVGASVDLCSDATYTNYNFVAWTTIKDDATSAVSSPYTLNVSTTLYALWQKQVKVTYVTNGLTLAGGCSAVTYVNPNTNIILCGVPTANTGYEFSSWVVNGTDSCSASATYAVGTTDVVITAKWIVPERTFTFINQGMGSDNQQTVAVIVALDGTYVTTPSVVAVPVNCEGREFVGWVNRIIQNPEEEVPATFVAKGGTILVSDVSAGNWFAVFAASE